MGRFPTVEKEIVSEEKDNTVRDEVTLAKLLEAAYVLQEHNRERREMELSLSVTKDQVVADERFAPTPPRTPQPRESEPEPAAKTDYTFTLAQIVETQHEIQVRHLELEGAMSLVAERLIQIARASGAALGVLDRKSFRYRATSGLLTLPEGTDVPMEKALCAASLRTGEVVRCANVNLESLLDTEECRRRGIRSLIAVPVFHDGRVAGGLELYYARPQAFTDQDVHTCQLMAGLVTEALARDEEADLKKSMETERAVMLEALEKLKPNLAALVDRPPGTDSSAKIGVPAAAAASASAFVCRRCGHKLVGEEQFCGNCGTPRSSDYEPPSMQSKVASLWHMQEAMKKNPPADVASGGPAPRELRAKLDRDSLDRTSIDRTSLDRTSSDRRNPDRVHSEKSLGDSLAEEMPELFAVAGQTGGQTTESVEEEDPISAEFEESVLSDLEIPSKPKAEDEVEGAHSTALAKRATAWSSAATARAFLEQVALAKRPGTLAQFWNTRRGDIYLAIAIILVAIVIRWGIFSGHPVSATGNPPAAAAAHRKPADQADLSLFDRMLISMGLAEAPPPPESKGNPDTQVWIDLHTALYYCPGADLYGKTPKGKFTSQRDAQLDQFEPAYRKACN
jgi:putative methionine-R-sulfoxide reductase with GAF domain